MRVIRFGEQTATPWANGGGHTVTLLQHPAHAEPTEVIWRLSVAEIVGSSAFSMFRGLSRWFVPLTDEVEVTVDEQSNRVHPLDALSFDGADRVSTRQHQQTTHNLNIMVRTGAVDLRLRRCTLEPGESLGPRLTPSSARPIGDEYPGELDALVVLDGRLTGASGEVAPWSLVTEPTGCDLAATAPTHVLHVHITLADRGKPSAAHPL
ncbi:HutD family protein [Pseudoclavibacter sp. CFCC 13796]|uniref:HutD family protein n=1 Tax=Pseudoclavibacter sp. CFCC 13796 TaxID=2615179 RepID=UPI0013011D4B|nr:HutD family protein [Pseudoclavibacter sp. CFCC 13796]KAB1660857.1 HutD family protein [Pseudoclavibacter sp. CFCC 13796]